MKISKNLRAALLTLSLVMLVVLVTVSIIVFHNKVTGVFRQLSIQSISEVQDLYTQALQAKFSDLSAMLEAQARYFSDEDLSSPETLKKIISNTKGIGDFKKVAIASKDGVCTNYTGQSLANVRGKPYFTRTINTAQPQVSSKIELDENLEPTLSLTYPIMNGNKVDAVIIGTLSYGVLKNLFSVAMFSGTSYTYIIANDGNIILCNKDKQRTLYNVNFYEYLKNNTDEDNPGISRM